MPTRYKILVIYDDGEQEFLRYGDQDAIFPNKLEAESQAAFMRVGLGPEEGIQSISVVKQ